MKTSIARRAVSGVIASLLAAAFGAGAGAQEFHGHLPPHVAAKMASDVTLSEGVQCLAAGGYWKTSATDAYYDRIEAMIFCQNGSAWIWRSTGETTFGVQRVR